MYKKAQLHDNVSNCILIISIEPIAVIKEYCKTYTERERD